MKSTALRFPKNLYLSFSTDFKMIQVHNVDLILCIYVSQYWSKGLNFVPSLNRQGNYFIWKCMYMQCMLKIAQRIRTHQLFQNRFLFSAPEFQLELVSNTYGFLQVDNGYFEVILGFLKSQRFPGKPLSSLTSDGLIVWHTCGWPHLETLFSSWMTARMQLILKPLKILS